VHLRRRRRAREPAVRHLRVGNITFLRPTISHARPTLLALGRAGEAADQYRAALAIADQSQLPVGDRGNARFNLARAMVRAGESSARARALALAGRALLVAAGPGYAKRVEDVDDWLRKPP
jgi:hypothetical protein